MPEETPRHSAEVNQAFDAPAPRPWDPALPEGFDATSEDDVRALPDEDLVSVLDSLNPLHEGAAGFSNDLADILLDPSGFRPEARPEDVAVARSLIRELIRRTAEKPEWQLTQDYLFGDQDGK